MDIKINFESGFDKVVNHAKNFATGVAEEGNKLVGEVKKAGTAGGYSVLGIAGFVAKVYNLAIAKFADMMAAIVPSKYTEYFTQMANQYREMAAQADKRMHECFEKAHTLLHGPVVEAAAAAAAE